MEWNGIIKICAIFLFAIFWNKTENKTKRKTPDLNRPKPIEAGGSLLLPRQRLADCLLFIIR